MLMSLRRGPPTMKPDLMLLRRGPSLPSELMILSRGPPLFTGCVDGFKAWA